MAIALHFCFGQFGWFSRYEVYIWTASVLLMLFIVTRKIRGSLSASTSCIPAALLTVFFAVTSPAYLYALVMTPVAANNIYEQQYQIRRFLTEFYQKPLAINDIGLPSFRNDVYVLDIWGLASKAALENRLKKRSNHWMNALAAQHHVDLAVVYETDSLPDNWIPLAEWTLSRRRITPAFDTVTVFSLNPDQIPVQKKRLSRFSETLPPGVSWRWRE